MLINIILFQKDLLLQSLMANMNIVKFTIIIVYVGQYMQYMCIFHMKENTAVKRISMYWIIFLIDNLSKMSILYQCISMQAQNVT